MAGQPPTVSVVIPCYNLGAFLDEAVESVLRQTFQDFEILVVDDGSTDPATRFLMDSYRRPKTRVLRSESRGVAGARNLGIAAAAGRFVTCLGADDLFEPTFLEKTVALLEREPGAAFASCWLTAFGARRFDWRPETCDFPWLLAECTVCTAALQRREAVVAAGGYDGRMPVAGWEGWDLAITLVERGLGGRIVPEPLFRYRIRPDSMSASCMEPGNHVRLMRYLVDKHAASYRRQLSRVLGIIEQRTAALEEMDRAVPAAADEATAATAAGLEHVLAAILSSVSWRLTAPLRRAKALVLRRLRTGVAAPPTVSVVVRAGNDALALARTVASVRSQGRPDVAVVVVGGARAPLGRQILEGLRADGARVLPGTAEGVARARAPWVLLLDEGETLEPGFFEKVLAAAGSDPGVGCVWFGLREDRPSGFVWALDDVSAATVLAACRLPWPLVRADLAGDAAMPPDGGSSMRFRRALALRLLESPGVRTVTIAEPLVRAPARPRDEEPCALMGSLFDAARPLYEADAENVVVAKETLRRRYEATVERVLAPPEATTTVDWGTLRRLEPVSRVWGLDRGQPVDRWYIERFLDAHRADIRGRVLEVKDPYYSRCFGSAVEAVDVLDVAPDNPAATVVADLAAPESLPVERYDCFVLTQTVHVIYDVRRVLDNAARTLRPGGVLLATLPCVSRIDYESGLDGDFWRFTPASARRLFAEVFGEGNVTVEGYGNVLTACGFLMGLASGDFAPAELEHRDPYHPLVVGVRAVRAGAAGDARAKRGAGRAVRGKAVILLYHRVASPPPRDRWALCVSPENFEAHMQLLAREYQPVALPDLLATWRKGRLPPRAVAVTFDDGYRDNLTAALPLLRDARVPATFFLATGGLEEREPFWWDRLEAGVEALGTQDGELTALHARLMTAPEEEHRRMLASLPSALRPLPPRLGVEDLRELAAVPGVTLGAHGTSHRSLGAMPPEEQRREMASCSATLERILGAPVRLFAYPFGGRGTFDDVTVVLLRRADYEAAFTIEAAPVRASGDPFALPRVLVPDLASAEFAARLEALFDD